MLHHQPVPDRAHAPLLRPYLARVRVRVRARARLRVMVRVRVRVRLRAGLGSGPLLRAYLGREGVEQRKHEGRAWLGLGLGLGLG